MTEWHRVVFSDESRFCLSSDSRRVRVWRRRGERSNPAAIGTMMAQRYVDDVLRPVTLPYLQGVPNALYQQDNARPHTARISQQALQDVQMLPWPPYSPDLSPIEHVWDIIGRRLHALPQPRSEDELWQMVLKEDKKQESSKMDTNEIRAVIKYLGRISTEEEHRPGRPVESVTQENIDKIYDLVILDRRMTVRQIEETLVISKTTVDRIMREHLGLRKLSACWVPKLLTPDQKTIRRKLSLDNIALFEANSEEFVNRFVNMDETWTHHFTPESKQQSMQWRHSGSPPPKKAKTVPSAGKVMVSVF
ncbi:hypothetical protein LAZ67_9003782 [Cordylochernes scorpioides]|uniref:Tc1-like transposase DDE domain-containing protein n=1 Tax=Cordylochernes scorpioides TaxID=51811 RepID=A0ABY6KUL6_9ARAC|nr:hypothetical protein LAZ67_9003782 [Cordylochernes scorpioides]